MVWNDLIPRVRLQLGAVINTNPPLAVFSREEQRINGETLPFNAYRAAPDTVHYTNKR